MVKTLLMEIIEYPSITVLFESIRDIEHELEDEDEAPKLIS
jgi:hypothetical protein